MKGAAIASKGRLGLAEARARLPLPRAVGSTLALVFLFGTALEMSPAASAVVSADCPNQEVRAREGATALPACRAYELASSPDKEGQAVVTVPVFMAEFLPQAAASGDAVAFTTTGAYGDATSNGLVNTYRSRRSADGWVDGQISPPLAPVPFLAGGFFEAFTPDLSRGALVGGWEPPLTPDASPGSGNLYLRDNLDGSYRLLSPGAPAGAEELGFRVVGISAAGEHVVFESPVALSGPCGGSDAAGLCDWSAATGALERVGVRPSGEAAVGAVSIAGPRWQNPVSADGSSIFFHEAGGGECGVCVRVDGAVTRLVSEGGTFWGASEDGSKAFLTSGGELERYDGLGGGLSPLTSGGEVLGVAGVAADGSRAYFVATAALASGAVAGVENLYLWSAGRGIELVATGSANGTFAGSYSRSRPITARVTPDGTHLAFTADHRLAGLPDEGRPQIYLYSADDGQLACASCSPGAPRSGAGTTLEGASWNGSLSRNLTDEGDRLFFSTEEALVPADANGIVDTYEYDAGDGKVALISSGRDEPVAFSESGSQFADASADGRDVFFVSKQPLVGVDRDEVADVYDARMGGGFEAQNPLPSPPPCEGGDCRALAATPDPLTAASATFAGPGSDRQRRGCAFYRRRAHLLGRRAEELRSRARTLARRGREADRERARELERAGRRLARAAQRRERRAQRLARLGRQCSQGLKGDA